VSRRTAALALVLITLSACTSPAATPDTSASPAPSTAPSAIPTSTPAAPAPAVETPNRTSEPGPTPPPQALLPVVRVVPQTLSLAPPTTLIEVVGRYRTDTEAAVRLWVPSYLQALDRYRGDPTESNRATFDAMHAPGPYRELIRQSLGPWFGSPGTEANKRAFELGQFTIQHMYAKPWGRVAYIDATLTFTDRITAADGTTSAVQRVQQGRYANQGQGMYKVLDGYDPMVTRWVDGEQPRWSALALEAEAPNAIGYFLQRESFVPGEPYAHGAPPGQRFLITVYDNARNDALVRLDASYKKGEFTTRRFDDVAVRVSRFEPATFLGDGVVTVTVTAQLREGANPASLRSTPVTRTLRFYRITRDGVNAFWQVVDEQGANGAWLSGGDLALAEIDQDRG
jgi:hypothetical protein